MQRNDASIEIENQQTGNLKYEAARCALDSLGYTATFLGCATGGYFLGLVMAKVFAGSSVAYGAVTGCLTDSFTIGGMLASVGYFRPSDDYSGLCGSAVKKCFKNEIDNNEANEPQASIKLGSTS